MLNLSWIKYCPWSHISIWFSKLLSTSWRYPIAPPYRTGCVLCAWVKGRFAKRRAPGPARLSQRCCWISFSFSHFFKREVDGTVWALYTYSRIYQYLVVYLYAFVTLFCAPRKRTTEKDMRSFLMALVGNMVGKCFLSCVVLCFVFFVFFCVL